MKKEEIIKIADLLKSNQINEYEAINMLQKCGIFGKNMMVFSANGTDEREWKVWLENRNKINPNGTI